MGNTAAKEQALRAAYGWMEYEMWVPFHNNGNKS
jgi:hypothetical protein